MNNIQVTITKTDGKLLFRNTTEEKAYNDFIANLPEGAQADIFMSTDASGKSTTSQ